MAPSKPFSLTSGNIFRVMKSVSVCLFDYDLTRVHSTCCSWNNAPRGNWQRINFCPSRQRSWFISTKCQKAVGMGEFFGSRKNWKDVIGKVLMTLITLLWPQLTQITRMLLDWDSLKRECNQSCKIKTVSKPLVTYVSVTPRIQGEWRCLRGGWKG